MPTAASLASAPRVEDAKSSPDANCYSLLLVALLERGEPITLEDVAVRLAAAGVAQSPGDALASLKRCRPARAPICRDGNHYALDPHDDEVSFWLFRLGLRPPRVAPLKVVGSAPDPLPSPDHRLTVANLNEAWRDGVPNSWSALRTSAVCRSRWLLVAHWDGQTRGLGRNGPTSRPIRGRRHPCWRMNKATRFHEWTSS